MSCDGCHGGGALGWVGPSLVDGRWRYGGADEEIFQSIFYGRPKGMPAYGGVLGAEGVWMIVRYLKAQPVPAVVPTTSYEDLASNAVPTAVAPAAPGASQPEAADPSSKLAKYGCTACHAVDTKVVGPSFKDVAARYQGRADAAQMLEQKVRDGGAGVWGDIPMPPNPAVPDADLLLQHLRGVASPLIPGGDVFERRADHFRVGRVARCIHTSRACSTDPPPPVETTPGAASRNRRRYAFDAKCSYDVVAP